MRVSLAVTVFAGVIVTGTPRASAASGYSAAVISDSPGTYWRLGEASGTVAADASGQANLGTYQAGTTLAQAGAIVGDTDKAITVNGLAGYVSSTTAAQSVATLDVWFLRLAATTKGGLLVGVDATQTGPGTLTEALYMNDGGSVLFGLSSAVAVQSTATFKDGKWHHAVGTSNGSSMSLYLDGILVQSKATLLVPAAGFVRAGYDTLAGWVGAPTNFFFTGNLDEAAFYPTALSASQVGTHFAAAANLPAAPAIGTATGGVNQVVVNWTAVPVGSIGGSAITGYRVFTFQAGQQVAVMSVAIVVTATVKGLAGTYTFKVGAMNSEGMGPLSVATAAATASGANQYFQVVRGDSPTSYWRLSDPYGLTAVDASASGANVGTFNNGVTRTQAGNLSLGSGSSPDGDLALLLDGTTASVTTSTSYANPTNYSIEAWFKSSSATGGGLIGFDNGGITTDRVLFLNNAGNVVFGVNPGVMSVVVSPLTYRTNAWHHVVATQSTTSGMALYVDGYLVAANPAVTSAGNNTGTWRMGFAKLTGWPQAPTSNFLIATLDEVAVYSAVLTPAQVLAHFQAAFANPNAPVTTSVTAGVNSATLVWVLSTKIGESAITAYRVSAYNAGVLQDTVTVASTTTVTMKGLLGSSYSFKITPWNSEGSGATATFAATPIISGAATYGSTVASDSPSLWYRFSDPTSALSVADQSGGTNTGTYQFGVTRMVAGAYAASTGGSPDADVAVTLNGTTGSIVSSAVLSNPNPFSEEIWFKTATATGGPLFGFDNGGAADRVLYMTNAGNLVFGVNPGAMSTITSPKTYKDGFWHHVVASLGAGGMILSVDGYQVASNTAVTTAANITGNWRLGQETLTGWPSVPTSSFLTASLDDAATYSAQLTAGQVQAHFAAAAITPGAPLLGAVTPGTNTTLVNWTAPAIGDSAILSYHISASSGGQLQDTVTALAAATSATIYGLVGTYTFTVRAVNSEGTGTPSTASAGTAVAGGTTFFSAVATDNPSTFWRFDDPALASVTDASAAGTNPGSLINGVTIDTLGALGSTTDADTALTIDGTTGYVSSSQQFTSTPTPFSIEVKFNTATATGGVLADMGTAATGLSGSIDRVLYVTNAGNIVFGLNPGAKQTVSSPLTYRDAHWHTATATVTAGGVMTLYIDSSQVATGATTSTNSSGYWRAGFDNLAGWPSAPTSNFLSGSIDELATFPIALSPAQITAHFLAGGQVPSAPGVPVLSAPQKSQMTATWTVPTSVGQSPIVSYTLSASAPGLSTENITVLSPTVTATIGGLASGVVYNFSVVATNSQGSGPASSITGTPAGTVSTYLPAILADGATQYYRLDEATGTAAWDFAPTGDIGTFTGGFTLSPAGATASDGDTATTLNGTTGLVTTSPAIAAPASVTVEAWFKYATATGGVLAGFGNLQSGTSSTFDRVLYLTNAGLVVFGINNGGKVSISSPVGTAYNDGKWHMAVGTLATGGAANLYIDGIQVANNAGPLTAVSYAGYWRIGNQTVTGYATAPTSFFLNGTIDEVAIIPAELTAAQIQNEFVLSGALPGAPTGLSTAVSGQNMVLTFSAPSIGDSPITSYAITATEPDAPTQTVTVPASPGLVGGLVGSLPYSFTVAANNAEGQGPSSATASATTGPTSVYYAAVQADAPSLGWYRTDETQGTAAFTSAAGGGPPGKYNGGFTLSQSGGLASDNASKAVLLNGTTGYVSAPTTCGTNGTDVLATVEIWFKTNTLTGGELSGFGSAQTGSSATTDRVLYMTNAGKLTFGVHPAGYSSVTSPLSYNDNQWHLADATWDVTVGLQLFVDDQLVAADVTATSDAGGSGFCRVGDDNLTGWPLAPTSNFFAGTVDEAAFYPFTLTAQQVDGHFSASGAAPGAPTITTVTPSATAATVSWTAPTAGISPLLSYTVTASVGGVVKQSSTVSNVTTSTPVGGLTPGTAYSIVVTATNSEGSTPSGAVATTTTGTPSTYRQAVSADGPSLWYRLDESSGTTAWDSSGNLNTGTYRGAVTLGAAGALPGDGTDTAVRLDGSSGYVSSATVQNNPTLFTIEAWLKTTSSSGGLIAGFGNLQTGLSATTDRVLYLTNAGTIVFGTNPSGVVQTITSPSAANDGAWHYIVATLSASGMVLYVDGSQAGSNPATGARNMSGYWRAGYDQLVAAPPWPSAPTSNFLAGTLDEVAIYPTALTLAQVQTHFRAAVGTVSISLTGLSTSFTVAGNPNSTATQLNAVTYNINTNDPLGYTASVQALGSTLTGASSGNPDFIPIANVAVRAHGGSSYQPLSDIASVTVHHTTTGTGGGGDNLGDDYQVTVPFANSDTYSVGLTYVAAAN